MAQNEGPHIVSPRMMALFNRRLGELNITKTEFIEKFHKEHGDQVGNRTHMFKILAGGTTVGEYTLLPMMAKTMKLDMEEAKAALHADIINRKKLLPPRYSKTVQKVAELMEHLDKKDQEEILNITKMKSKARLQ